MAVRGREGGRYEKVREKHMRGGHALFIFMLWREIQRKGECKGKREKERERERLLVAFYLNR